MESKNTYHEKKVFDILESWKPVDVPDYFETRILSRLETVRSPKVLKWGWATLVTVLMINVFAATRYVKHARAKNEATYEQYLESNPEVENYYSAQS